MSDLGGVGDKLVGLAGDLLSLEPDSEERPSGDYSAQMTESGAWPESNASTFIERKAELEGKLSSLDESLFTWERYGAQIFNGMLVWSGVSASAADGRVANITQSMQDQRLNLKTAIAGCSKAAATILIAKSTIRTAVQDAQSRITTVINNAAEDEADPTTDIQRIVNETWLANARIVNEGAERLGAQPDPPGSPPFPEDDEGDAATEAPHANVDSGPVQEDKPSLNDRIVQVSTVPEAVPPPPTEAGPKVDLLGREVAPSPTPANEPAPSPAPESEPHVSIGESERTPSPTLPASSEREPTPYVPVGSPSGQQAAANRPTVGGSPQTSSGAPSAGPSSSPVSGAAGTATGAGEAPSQWGESGSAIDASSTEASANASQAGHSPTNPVEAFMQGYAEAEPSMNPASAGSSPTAPVAQTAPVAPDSANTSTQAAGHNPSAGQPNSVAPVGQSAPAAPLNAGSPMSGGGMGGMPLAPPPTVSPAAPPPMAPPPVAPASAPPAPAAAAAPIPVSTARRERDAIAAVSRRGNDPSQVATRIAAALNAIPTQDFGFYWVTALTVDGTIVIANSYGIGYIPEGVNLPEQVKMASADESIPAVDRGKWATYPMLTLKGWAEQHSTALRMVIATESQFQGFDPGAAKMILQPDDIPENGQMQGRSRLEVIAPQAAAQLAAVSDADLPELLPVAPADGTPPADATFQKWFNVMKPMMSQSDERGQFHLKAFIEYANYSQEKALHSAHTAADATTLRAAIADWIYWQHLGVLTADALAELQPS